MADKDVIDSPGMAPAVAVGCTCLPRDGGENPFQRWPDWDCRGCPVHEAAQDQPLRDHVTNQLLD